MTKRSPLPVWVVVACCVVLGQFRALTLLGFAPAGKHEESSSSFQSEESSLTRGTLAGVRDQRFQDGMPLNPFNLSLFSMDVFAAKESARRKPKSTSSNSRKKNDPPWRLPGVKTITSQVEAGDKSAGSFMLDFAIVGFPKTGSSTMMLWLGRHADEIAAFKYEVKTLQTSTPIQFIRQIYTQLPNGPLLRGYKSPTDLENRRALNKLSTFFPTTRLIVGIRHPIRWFESFYNFRIQNENKKKRMAPANEIGLECWKSTNGVCGGRAMFHKSLAVLGKTPMTDPAELALFHIGEGSKSFEATSMVNQTQNSIPNHVFIYDLEQLGDSNDARARSFRKAIQDYLGVNEELQEVLHVKPGKTDIDSEDQRRRNERKIDICDEKFTTQRVMLLEIATKAQDWIRSYFLKSSDVFVGNRQHFLEILEAYRVDPCLSRPEVSGILT